MFQKKWANSSWANCHSWLISRARKSARGCAARGNIPAAVFNHLQQLFVGGKARDVDTKAAGLLSELAHVQSKLFGGHGEQEGRGRAVACVPGVFQQQQQQQQLPKRSRRKEGGTNSEYSNNFQSSVSDRQTVRQAGRHTPFPQTPPAKFPRYYEIHAKFQQSVTSRHTPSYDRHGGQRRSHPHRQRSFQ